MADGFDINTPSPDDGHEAIRVAVVAAIEELGWNTSDVGASFDLLDTLFVLLDSALTANDALAAQVADLEARVTALEPAPTPEEPAP